MKKTTYKSPTKADQEIIDRCMDARREAFEANSENIKAMLDDLRFCALDQWPQEIKDRKNGQLMLTLDKVNQGVKAVIGEMRDNRPSVRVLPVDDDADVETAKVFSGLIRTIEQTSNATSSVYMRAGELQVKCGYGAWRIENEFAAHDVFEQDLYIRYIKNPFNWGYDPRANSLTKADGRYIVGLCQMHKDDFKKKFPEIEPTKIDELFEGEGFGDWVEDEDVVFCEFYEKRPKKFTLCLLSNGHTIEKDKDYQKLADANGLMIVKEREVDSFEIVYQKVTGNAVFDQQTLPTQYFPVIPVYGEVESIEGNDYIRGLVRPAKDPQRLYNYVASADVEQMALQPKAPFIGTAKMFKAWKSFWMRANKDNLPFLPYTPDPQAPGMRPERSQPPVASSGLVQRAAIASDDIRSSMGVHEASFAQQSNAVSGKAKLIEQQSASITNSVYMDHLSIAIEHTGRVLVDMIPSYYDTMRVIRIMGEDGQEEEVNINRPYLSADGKRIEHDLTRGKYDVRMSVGPSYRTKRQQAADMLFQLAGSYPGFMEQFGDILAKNLDIPYADELEERMRKFISMRFPGIIEEKDPEKKAAMQQQAQQQSEQQQQMLMIQIKDILSKIEETQSKTELNKAKSAETLGSLVLDKEKLSVDKLQALQSFLANMASTTPQ